jgi:hypothetical protein
MNSASTEVLVQRIQAAAQHELGVTLVCGAASFPDGALTFEDLLSQAEKQVLGPADRREFAGAAVGFTGLANTGNYDNEKVG